MAIEIKEVTTKKELKQFIQFGIDLFKGNPYFCPPLVFDEINTFDTLKIPHTKSVIISFTWLIKTAKL